MDSIGEAVNAWEKVTILVGNIKHELSAGDRHDEVVSTLQYLTEDFQEAVDKTEHCVSPELSTRVALSKAIERALALGINLDDISSIYYDEIDRRI